MRAQILIAGISSGVGKTTITLGLIAALRRRGLRVQPFKAGPDYIDPTYHTLAAGRPCRNIDTWMVPPDRALELYHQAVQTADVAVIEGVMGVFDGFSYTDEEGSTAQIAKLLDAPVLLVLDVGKMARSAGALALGYTRFDSSLKVAGFILNRCGSASHYQGVKQAIEQATALPVLGWLPKQAELHIPERHLGLVPTDERGELTNFIACTADLIEQYFDLEQILAIAGINQSPLPETPSKTVNPKSKIQNEVARRGHPKSKILIAVARDSAFSFYYEDNLAYLSENGAEVIFFSPQQDQNLPEGISGLYLGGGFPEMYAALLSKNHALLTTLRRVHAAGMPIYAECGGFMYLTEGIVDLEDRFYPMAGLVPGITRMQPRLVSLGYRLVESPTGNFLLPKGVTTRGHEFHWSTWELNVSTLNVQRSISGSAEVSTYNLQPAWHIRPRQGESESRPDGYAHNNLIASYIHLHFAHNLQLAYNFVQACQKWLQTA